MKAMKPLFEADVANPGVLDLSGYRNPVQGLLGTVTDHQAHTCVRPTTRVLRLNLPGTGRPVQFAAISLCDRRNTFAFARQRDDFGSLVFGVARLPSKIRFRFLWVRTHLDTGSARDSAAMTI